MKIFRIVALFLALVPALAFGQVVSRDDAPNVPGVSVVTTADGKQVALPAVTVRNISGAGGGNPTYVASGFGYSGYTSPTDITCIRGSASKVVLVTNILILAQATASTPMRFDFIKRITVNTGGTPTTITANKHDSLDAAASAVVQTYATAPTLGTAAGTLYLSSSSATATTSSAGIFSMSNTNVRDMPRLMVDLREPITLRGTGEQLCVNIGAQALPAGFTAAFIVEWVEV